jgi:hypothetical protein
MLFSALEVIKTVIQQFSECAGLTQIDNLVDLFTGELTTVR